MLTSRTWLYDRSLALAGLLFVLFALAYLGFSGAVSPGEMAVAALAAALATWGTLALMSLADMQEFVEARWLVRLARPILDMAIEVVPLTRALVQAAFHGQALSAELETRRFDPGRADEPRDRGRRAMVTIAISLAPARLVVDSDTDAHEITTCRLGVKEMATMPKDPRWPL